MKKLFLLLIPALSVVGCSGVKVITDYDKTVDFSQYKTFEYYGWAEESDKILNRFDKERIEKAFGQEFKNRGMEYVQSGGDLIVTLFVVVEEKTETTATTTGYGGAGYYGHGPGYGWGSGYSTTTINEYDYMEGTLVIDVFDAKSKTLVWESIGTKTIVEDPEQREKSIPAAVSAIMSTYPVRPVAAQ